MPIDSQVEVKQVRLVKGTGSQIAAARQAGEILETDLVAQTDAPDLVTANADITGATKCKITYDSKGLVTAGADLNSSDITTALGYTPYNSTNPSGYQANVIETVKVNGTALTPSSKAVDITVPTNNNQLTNGAGYITSSALNGYATQTWVGQQGYLTGITSSDVTTALGYTPYNSSNPNGYTSNVGTVTSVNNVQPVNGNVTISIPTVNNATLTIQKNGSNVATFTANSSTNQTANITVPTDNADLTNGAGYITSSALSNLADTNLSNITATGKETAVGLIMPSNTGTALTLGATGAYYTMTKDGYIALDVVFDSAGTLFIYRGNGTRYGLAIPYNASMWVDAYLIVKKGDTIMIQYNGNAYVQSFNFIPAEGEA